MERPVKERLVGATILVALIVLIVPELLSGSKPPAAPALSAGPPAPTRNISVDLTTSKATPVPQSAESAPAAAAATSGAAAPVAAAPDVASPVGDAPAASAVTTAPPTVSTLRAQAASAAALETEPPAPNSPTETPTAHGWAVQLGSFVSRANAEKLVHQMKATGSVVYVTSSGSGRSRRYRVRTAPMPDRAAAEHAAAKLKAAGRTVTIVSPAS